MTSSTAYDIYDEGRLQDVQKRNQVNSISLLHLRLLYSASQQEAQVYFQQCIITMPSLPINFTLLNKGIYQPQMRTSDSSGVSVITSRRELPFLRNGLVQDD